MHIQLILRRIAAITAIVAVVAVAAAIGGTPNEGSVATLDTPLLAPAVAADPTALDADINRFSARIEVDRTYVDVRTLGSLYLERGTITGSTDDYANADVLLTEAAERDPDDADGGILLAQAALARHDFARAQQVARRVIAIDPAQLAALAIEADALLDLGETAAAQRNLTYLADVLPNDASITIRLAELAYATGDSESVRMHVAAAVKQVRTTPGQPNLAFYLTYAGDRLRSLGDVAAAEVALIEALELTPNDTTAAFALGWVRVSQDDFEGAAELFAVVATELPEPDHLQAWGEVLTALGRADRAAAVYDRAAAAATRLGDDPAWRGHVTRFIVEHGDPKEALRLAEAELQVRQDPGTYALYGRALHVNGRHDAARIALDTALQTGFRSPQLLYHSALVWHALGERDAAMADAAAAIAIDPSFHPLEAPAAAAIAAGDPLTP